MARQDLSCGPVFEESTGGQPSAEAFNGADTTVASVPIVAALSVPTRLPRGDAGAEAAKDGEASDTCPPAIKNGQCPGSHRSHPPACLYSHH
ncbi:hypothetical protein [Kitasatospora sp. NPDC056181]|uniref:hypothetical protein n=1 Tax=Kitasatospora sp. NPDC056181 TaxID=3345737 RepID=UPI0035D53A06